MFIKERIFSFTSMAYAGDTFAVATFSIQEGISELYDIELVLASKESDIDFPSVLDAPANCIIHQGSKNLTLSAIVKEFEQLHNYQGHSYYRARLGPKLWWLTLAHQNRVFLDKTVPQILEAVLQDSGLTRRDYEFRLKESYEPREMVCQYNESSYDFFKRWLAREGMYYYFERLDSATKVIVTDTKIAHKELKSHDQAHYAPFSGLEQPDQPAVRSFVCRQRLAPAAVRRRDHNYQTPDLKIQAERQVEAVGRGVDYIWGENLHTPSEADRLAQQQAQAHKVRSLAYHGESTVPSMRSGFLFSLANHYRSDFNQHYLVTDCHHMGNQLASLEPEIQEGLASIVEEEELYRNSFSAIPADVQYRLPLMERKSFVRGVLKAAIAGKDKDSIEPAINEVGRYKVVLPQVLTGDNEAQTSAWLPLVKPYDLSNGFGMHFPLTKDVEVLLAFIDGDPDQPVIAGTVPTATHTDLVNNNDWTYNRLRTGGDNRLEIQDYNGKEYIRLDCKNQDTWLRLGNPSDDESRHEGGISSNVSKNFRHQHNTGGFRFHTEGDVNGSSTNHMNVGIGGNLTNVIIGSEEHLTGGFFNRTVVGAATILNLGARLAVATHVDTNIKFAAQFSYVGGVALHIYDTARRTIRPKAFDISDDETKFNQIKTNIASARTQLLDSNSSTSQETSTTAQTSTSLIEVDTNTSQSRNQTSEESTDITQDSQDLSTNKLGMYEEQIKMLNQQVKSLQTAMTSAIDSIEIVNNKTFI